VVGVRARGSSRGQGQGEWLRFGPVKGLLQQEAELEEEMELHRELFLTHLGESAYLSVTT